MNYQRLWRSVAIVAVFALLLFGSTSYAATPSGSSQPQAQTLSQPNVAEPPAWHDVYPSYYGIKMVSATNGWIVGHSGIIKHYYNGGWGDYPSPTTGTLLDIDAIPGEGWAVGLNNTLIHLVGTDWQVSASPAPPTTTLNSVKIVAPDEAWAIGNNIVRTDSQCSNLTGSGASVGNQPFILHYSGGSWQLVSTPVITDGVTLHQMSWTSPSDGWLAGGIVGQYNTISPIIFHYDGTTWSRVYSSLDSSYGAATSIFMLSPTVGWAGLNTCLDWNAHALHYDGTSWTVVPAGRASEPAQSPHTAEPIPRNDAGVPDGGGFGAYSVVNDIIAFTPDNFYDSGYAISSCAWCEDNYYYGLFKFIHTEAATTALSGVAANDIWLVGVGGLIAHWNGSSLTTNAAALRGSKVQMLAANDGWLLSSLLNTWTGDLHHYDGQLWSASVLTNVSTFAFATPSDGWAVIGSSGQVTFTHYTSGNWQPTQVLSGSVMSMQMLSPSEGWALGYNSNNNSIAYHYSGGSWSGSPIDLNIGPLANFHFDSPTDGWAVGSSESEQLVYHYDGSTWTHIPIPFAYTIVSAVYALAPNDVWIGGTSGSYLNPSSTMWHWDGSTWTTTTVPASIYAIAMLSPTEGWAGGIGPMLHYTNGTWQATATDETNLNSLSFTSPTDGWAVSDYYVSHYYPACYDYYYDVPTGNFAATAVFYLSCKGIVSGTGNHIFSPNNPATRIQFAKLISLARSWPLITPTQQSFTDVPPSNPLYTYVETAHAHGAINGATPAGCTAAGATYPCFLPNTSISRAQTAIITQQAFAWPTDTTGGPHFTDVAQNFYAYNAIETCYNHGVVNGIGGGLFAPNANVTRAQIAVILYKALTLP